MWHLYVFCLMLEEVDFISSLYFCSRAAKLSDGNKVLKEKMAKK